MKYPKLHELLKSEAKTANLGKFDSSLDPFIRGFAIATCICSEGAIIKVVGKNDPEVDTELCQLHDYVVDHAEYTTIKESYYEIELYHGFDDNAIIMIIKQGIVYFIFPTYQNYDAYFSGDDPEFIGD